MDKQWTFFEEGSSPDTAGGWPPHTWTTNGMPALNTGTGFGVLFYETEPLPDLCGGEKGTIVLHDPITHYFTTTFSAPLVAPGAWFELHSVIDDGVVFYLNGTELFRWNMPAGPITYETFASSAVGNAACLTNFFYVTNLASGQNTLSAELHQHSTPMNVVFGAELVATVESYYTVQPTLYISKVDDRVLLYWSGPGFVLEHASSLDGGWTQVEVPLNQFFEPLSAAAPRFYRLRWP